MKARWRETGKGDRNTAEMHEETEEQDKGMMKWEGRRRDIA